MQEQKRFYSISDFLKETFGRKTVKLSLEGGFTCPNRDGTLGVGGCAFCSGGGSGEFASTISGQIELLSRKWTDCCYIAYFQSHTNTYDSVENLRSKYFAALDDPNISGIAISTRPDCLSDEVLDLLDEINRDHFMWVELGLQTIHPKTHAILNTCYTVDQFDHAVSELAKRNIRTVAHLILGLPGESREDMLKSVEHVVSKNVFGIKLHMLNIVKGSGFARDIPDYIPFDSIDEYVDLVIFLLEHIPSDITIHRLTADAPREILIAPEWSYRKRSILNAIDRELRLRNTKQGAAVE